MEAAEVQNQESDQEAGLIGEQLDNVAGPTWLEGQPSELAGQSEDTPQAQDQTQEQAPEADELPEKYRGKSVAEVARMHQEVEKALARQGNDLGSLRREIQEMRSSLQPKPEPQGPKPIDPLEYINNPEMAVAKSIENHPEVQRLRQVTQQVEQERSVSAVRSAHPDVGELLQSPDYQEWVNSSPVRKRRFESAGANFDADELIDLIDTYKQIKGTTVSGPKAVNQASTGGGRGSVEAGAANKRVFKASGLRRLLRENPQKYEAMTPEITEAYMDGRVVDD